MQKRIEEIAADVACMLGESLVLECEPEESPFPGLASRIGLLARECLATLLLESPKSMLDGWKPLRGELTHDAATGTATMALPEDFLRLGSVKYSGWKKSVDEITDTGDVEVAIARGLWPGIGVNEWRPLATIEPGEDGRVLRLYGCPEAGTLEHGLYMPMPALSGDTLEVPAALYGRLCREVVKASQTTVPL